MGTPGFKRQKLLRAASKGRRFAAREIDPSAAAAVAALRAMPGVHGVRVEDIQAWITEGRNRALAGQIEFWNRVGKAARDNPDLPVIFVADLLASLDEAREDAVPFIPRSGAA